MLGSHAIRALIFLMISAGTALTASSQNHCRVAPNAGDAASLPAPRLMSGLGTSTLPITTKSERAQAFFDQGVRLLHSFWDFEAYRAFREAARLDPDAAMPHWGIFTALGLNAREMAAERDAALKSALALSERATDREQHYIRSASYLADPAKGRAAYIAEMEALIDRYPEDVEAKLFLANTLSTPVASYAPDGRPREGKLYGQAILRNLLITHPEHSAVHHYWIHAVENGPRPQEALASAEKLPKLAPGSGHLLHMPGHIYHRLGRYAEARKAFLASMRRDLEYMKEQRVEPVNDWNYVHNLDYLVGNCAEDGNYDDGLRWARELESVALAAERLNARGAGYITYGAHTAVARLQMRYGMWEEAAKSLAASRPRVTSSPRSAAYLDAVLAFARGMAALAARDLPAANAQATELREASARIAATEPAMGSDWYSAHATRIAAVHELELRGAILSAEGKHAEAIATLREAVAKERDLGYWEPPHYARPVWETLAEAHVRAQEYDAAIEAWTRSLEQRPRNVHGLRGLERAKATQRQERALR